MLKKVISKKRIYQLSKFIHIVKILFKSCNKEINHKHVDCIESDVVSPNNSEFCLNNVSNIKTRIIVKYTRSYGTVPYSTQCNKIKFINKKCI